MCGDLKYFCFRTYPEAEDNTAAACDDFDPGWAMTLWVGLRLEEWINVIVWGELSIASNYHRGNED